MFINAERHVVRGCPCLRFCSGSLRTTFLAGLFSCILMMWPNHLRRWWQINCCSVFCWHFFPTFSFKAVFMGLFGCSNPQNQLIIFVFFDQSMSLFISETVRDRSISQLLWITQTKSGVYLIYQWLGVTSMTLSDLENLDGKKCAHTCNSPESVLKIVDVFIETRRRELGVQTWAPTGKGKGGHLTHLGRLEVHQVMH